MSDSPRSTNFRNNSIFPQRPIAQYFEDKSQIFAVLGPGIMNTSGW